MRYKRIENIKVGDLLHDNLYGTDGRLLVSNREPLTNAIIKRLHDLGYNGFYIDTENDNDINVADIITEQVRNNTIRNLNNLKNQFNNENVAATMENAVQIVNDILSQKEITIDYIDLRNIENNIFQHSIFVTEASVAIGIILKLDTKQLIELAIAALLHDIGKLFIDPKIMKKIEETNNQSAEEYIEDKHPLYAFRLFAKDRELGVNAIINKSILCHHLNENGTGTTGDSKYDSLISETPLYSKIIHVVDEYDIVKHNSVNGGPLEAVEYLNAGYGTLFDPEVVNAFRKVVAVYPTGTEITISNKLKGENDAIVAKGIVFSQNPGSPNRPKIKLDFGGIADLNTRFCQKFTVIESELDSYPEIEKSK